MKIWGWMTNTKIMVLGGNKTIVKAIMLVYDFSLIQKVSNEFKQTGYSHPPHIGHPNLGGPFVWSCCGVSG